MATITPQNKTGLNLALTYVAAAGAGDQVVNSKGSTVIVVRNDHATLTRTVTLNSYADVSKRQGVGQTDLVLTLAAAGGTHICGPLDKAAWNNPQGRVELAYSDSGADIKVAAYQG